MSAGLVVVVVGFPGSGKTTASKILGSLGYVVVSASEVVRRLSTGASEPRGRRSLQELGAALTLRIGVAAFADALIAAADGGSPIVVDGVRQSEVVAALRQRATRMIMVFIDAPQTTRLARLCSRDREAIDEAAALSSPIEQGVVALRDGADVVVRNLSRRVDFEREIMSLGKRFLEHGAPSSVRSVGRALTSGMRTVGSGRQ